MKKIIMMVAVCLMAAATFAEEFDAYDVPTNITSNSSVDEFTALQLLIHVNWIASRISMEGTVLEDEYKQINHEGLDLSYLKDEEARECLKSLSDAITNARKKCGDVKMAERVRDEHLRKALYESAPDPVAILRSDLRTMAFVAVQAAFSWYMNYQAIKAEVKLQYDQEMWRIEKDDMENINNFSKEMFEHQSRLVSQYKLDDSYRVTSEEFKTLFKWLDNFDDQFAYHMLFHNQKTYVFSTFYWYHRGVLAYKLHKDSEALKCFRTFQKIHRPFLRRDKTAAIVAQGIIELLLKKTSAPDTAEIKRQLDVIKRNVQAEDWEIHRFIATVDYNLLKDYHDAESHISKAIGHLELSYCEELKSYLARLCEEDELPLWKRKSVFSSEKLCIKENVPPSSENLMRCRTFLFQILTASKSENVDSYAANFWSRYDVSNIERLMYSSFLQDTNVVAGLCAVCDLKNGPQIVTNSSEEVSSGRLSTESKETITFDVIRIFAGSDLNNCFWAYIPLRWVYTMPTKITFSIYGKNGKEVFLAKENIKRRKIIIDDQKPVLAIEIDTRGAKKAVGKSQVSVFSINFEHPAFRSRMYVKAHMKMFSIKTAAEYETEFYRYVLTHPEYPLRRFGDAINKLVTIREYQAVATTLWMLSFFKNDIARPKILDDTMAVVTNFGKLESDNALDLVHNKYFTEIECFDYRDIKSAPLRGFLLMYENKFNNNCMVIDFSNMIVDSFTDFGR